MSRLIRLPNSHQEYRIPDHQVYNLMERWQNPRNGHDLRARYTFHPTDHPYGKKVMVEVWEEEPRLDYGGGESVGPEAKRSEHRYMAPIQGFLVSAGKPTSKDEEHRALRLKRAQDRYSVKRTQARTRFEGMYNMEMYNSPIKIPMPKSKPARTARPIPGKVSFNPYPYTGAFEKGFSKYTDPRSRGIDMHSKYPVGTRVQVAIKNSIKYGTIIRPSRRERENYLVCLDASMKEPKRSMKEPKGTRQLAKEHVPYPGYVLSVPTGNMSTIASSAGASWEGVPKWVGVMVLKPFVEGKFKFSKGMTGRILELPTDDLATIAWDRDLGCDARRYNEYCSVWSVPKQKLLMVSFARVPAQPAQTGANRMAVATWPEFVLDCPFEEGDIVVYQGSKGLQVETRSGGLRHVSNGAILQVITPDRRNLIAGCLGGVLDDVVGTKVRVPTDYLTPFQHEYMKAGAKVEIVAEVIFRRRDLRGEKALVVLSTDADGDVGLQFEESIRAGNLDGAGKDGRCLYVPAGALKVSK